MASFAYDGGGAGGKLRRRLLRRSATPYERPPSASRGVVRPPEHQRNGWLSRLVDPASRIISSGASRIFSSVFGKQQNALLPPPPPPPPPIPDEHPPLNQEASEAVCLNSLCEAQEEGAKDGDNRINNSDDKGIFELEQLLKQRTFTRAEFNYLTDLIQSRTIETAQEKAADKEASLEQPSKEAAYADKEKINDITGFHGNISTPSQRFPIPEEEVASPAEIAKAYMGSRPSKLSPSSLNLQQHVFREDTTSLASMPYAARSSDVAAAPRSIVRFSIGPEQPNYGYSTPRPLGRTAIYKTSRSPYFKVLTKAEAKGDMLGGDSYAGPSTSSHWAARTSISASKQILKRGNSESDHGSFGPIPRIRQKSNLMTPLKGICTPSQNLSPSSSTPISRDNLSGFTASQKPLQFNVQKYGLGSHDAKTHDHRILGETGRHIPPQSFEMAQQVLQKLDKIASSPKGKSSELKAISTDGSPSKLTLDVLQGQALRGIKGIDSSNFVNNSRNFTVDDTHDSLPQSTPQNQEVLQNGPLKPDISQVKLTPESAASVQVITPTANTKSDGQRASDFAISGFAAVPVQEKPGFKFSVVKGSLEVDDDQKFMFESKTSDDPVSFSFPATPSLSSFDSKAAQPATIFSSKPSDPAGLKSSTVSSTSNVLAATQQENSDLFGDKIQKAGELMKFKTFGSSVSSDFSSSASSSIFSFGTPAISSLNNGSLDPKSPTNFGSDASGSCNRMISTSNAATTTPSSSWIFSTAPKFSTVNSFQTVASTSACAPSSVSTLFSASGFKDLEAKSTKTTPFSFSGASSMGTSAISNPGVKDFSMSTSSSTLGTSSTLAVPAAFASSVSGFSPINTLKVTGSASFTSVTPSIFSSTFGSHSTLPSSSVLSITGSGIFHSSFQAQSSGSSTSFASNSSQSSIQSVAAASSFLAAQANSSSTPSFGLTGCSPSLGFGSSLFAQPAAGLASSSSQSAAPIFSTPANRNSPITFGSSSRPAFSFPASTVGTPSTVSFSSSLPQNNQMTTEDERQSTAPTFSSWIQPSFPIGSTAIPSSGIQQPTVQFSQQTSNVDPGGSFSLGSTGDDKAHRRFMRVKRGKTVKKQDN